MTVTLQIGNSDDKLTQKEWSDFVQSVDNTVTPLARQVHFSGTSDGSAPWQNAAWVFECNGEWYDSMRGELAELKEKFRQDSIAWTEGNTEFI